MEQNLTTVFIDSSQSEVDETTCGETIDSACKTLAQGIARLIDPVTSTIHLAGEFELNRVLIGTTQTHQWGTKNTEANLPILASIPDETIAASVDLFSYTGFTSLTGFVLSAPSEV